MLFSIGESLYCFISCRFDKNKNTKHKHMAARKIPVFVLPSGERKGVGAKRGTTGRNREGKF